MKKHYAKKSLSLFLALLMLLTAVPLTAVPAAAAGGTINQSGWALIYSGGSRVNESNGTFTVCGDIDSTNDNIATSIGFIDFDISGLSGTVDAKLNISANNAGKGSYNGEVFLEIFSIDPSKRPDVNKGNTDYFNSIFGSGSWTHNDYTHANYAKNVLGITGQPALATMGTKEMDNNQTKSYSFDISEALNKAVRDGQKKLCLAFLNPRTHKGNPSWSDINVFYKNANITYTSSGSKEIAHSGATLLYTDNNTRGDANHLNICSDGGRANTTAAFLKFDIGSIPASAASVSLSTSVWSAQNANSSVVADIFSIDPSKCINTNGWQTTDPYNAAFGSGTPSIAAAKTYFGATDRVAQLGIQKDGLSSNAKTVLLDITSAVKAAKNKGQSTLCLMIIGAQSYNGSASVGWSDINIAPGSTKLVCSESESANAYGNFGSGKYYVKLVLRILNNRWWNNGIDKSWVGFYYKPNNGTGEETHIDMPIAPGTFASASGDKVIEYVLDGFPTHIDLDCGGIGNTDNFECQVISLSIGSYAGKYTEFQKITYDKIWKLSLQGQDTRKTVVSGLSNDEYPYAKTFEWKTAPADTFVPYSGSNIVSAAVVAKDQYGVVMGTDYTATVEKFAQGNTISPIQNTGLSVSQSSKSDCVITVSDSARIANTDYFYGAICVDVADANNSQIGKGKQRFKIVNQKATVTIDPNGGELSQTSYQIYYGSPLNAKINTDLNGYAYPPVGTKEGHTLKGFYSSYTGGTKYEDTTEVLSNNTYYAQWEANKYTVKFLDADGNVLSAPSVDYGKSAQAPVNLPKKASDAENHYTFEKWDTDFSNVKSNLTVNPVYTATAHSFERDEANDTEATCEKNAVLAYKCDCDYTKTEEQADSALGHDWQENGKKAADCENDGYVSYICSACNDSKKETLSAIGHKYVETVIDAASCESTGLNKFVCENCKEYEQENGKDKEKVTVALGHDWSEWEITTEASCDSDGRQKRLCKRKGCEYEKKYSFEVINKSGHNWSEEIFTEESTCTKTGRTFNKCLNKNCLATQTVEILPLNAHTPGEWTTDVEPSCAHNGSEVQKCTVCEAQLDRRDITALDHDYSGYEKISDATCTEPAKESGKCSRCASTNVRNVESSKALGHDFKEENYIPDNNAGCEKDGTKTAKCSRCTATDTLTIEGSALGHSFKKYKSNNDATCTADGTKTAKCERCDKTNTISDVGSKKAHSISQYIYNDDATCTKNGTKTGHCTVCDEDITVEALDSKLLHSFTNYTLKSDATCLEDASEEAVCDYGCGTTDVRTVPGTKGEHEFPDPETEAEKYFSNNDSTCKQHGTKSAYCKTCGKAKKTIADPTSELKHRIVNWVSDNNATCTADGTKHGTCAFCGEYEEKNVADKGSALGHRFRDYKFDNNATCTKNGTRTATCERKNCTETETVEAKNTALGHDWSDWAFIEGEGEATVDCTTGGTKKRQCKRDGCTENETMEVAALGHTWTWITVKQDGESTDCTKGYYKIKECSVCHEQDEATRTEVAGGAHNFVVSEYVEPTCTAEGKRVVSCSVCKTVYSSTVLPKTEHINYSLDETSVKKPTCISKGYTGDYLCDVCDAVVVKGEEIAESGEHTYDTYVITTQATCTSDAIETASCSVCGKEPVTRAVPSSAFGHSFTDYKLDGNATCTGIATKTAKCDRCNATDSIKVYGTALGHDWSEWKETKKATCAEKGEAEKHCKRENCGLSVTKDLRRLSHTEGEWITDKEPTCEATGHRYKECLGGCGTVLKEETIKAKGHSYVVSENTATCIDDGFLTYTCTVCGETKNGGIVHALGHERGEWEIIKAPTCKKQGKKQAKCTVCGIVLATEVVEVTAHVDNDGDGYCDECSKDVGEPSYNGDCGCICHKTNPLMKLIYKILRFFWKIFGIRKTCYCKAIHY